MYSVALVRSPIHSELTMRSATIRYAATIAGNEYRQLCRWRSKQRKLVIPEPDDNSSRSMSLRQALHSSSRLSSKKMERESSHFVDTGILDPALASVETDNNWENAWETIVEVDEDSH